MASIRLNNSGKPAPKWFRKFKKIYSNAENAALMLLVFKYPAESPVFAIIKIGSSFLMETLDTLLADEEDTEDLQPTPNPQP